MFEIEWTQRARDDFYRLQNDASLEKRFKAVKKAIKLLAENPQYNSLQTHAYSNLQGPHGEKIFEAYAVQNTPGAYRVFWCYGPPKGIITIIAITPHP